MVAMISLAAIAVIDLQILSRSEVEEGENDNAQSKGDLQSK